MGGVNDYTPQVLPNLVSRIEFGQERFLFFESSTFGDDNPFSFAGVDGHISESHMMYLRFGPRVRHAVRCVIPPR